MSLTSDIRESAANLWHLHRVKRLVREYTGSGAQALITVTEITCDDPACPGPATQITIMGFDLVRHVLLVHRPAADVTASDLRDIDEKAWSAPANPQKRAAGHDPTTGF